MKTFLVTGGAGFIGSDFILAERRLGDTRMINLDLLIYAGNLSASSAISAVRKNQINRSG